jgi:pyruvate oxidase
MFQRTVADYLVEQLDAWGIHNIYGIPGDAILPFVDAINRHPRIRFICVKHESAAALMASAEAKLTGGIGVCAATSGPGVANLINGLADAKSDRAPVLAITGQVDSFNLGTNYKQYIDQHLLMAAVTDYSGLVSVPDSCNDVLVTALRKALTEGTVTHVCFTKDVWQIPTEEGVRPPEPYLRTRAQSPPEVIAAAVKRLNEAQRPAILAGRGVRSLGPQLVELAQKWQAGICTSLPAKGIVPGDYYLMLGGLGEGGSEASTIMLAEADLVLIIGATWWPEKYASKQTRIIQVDAVPGNIGKQSPVEYGVVGDLEVLLPEITRGIQETDKRTWVDRLSSLKEQWLARIEMETAPGGTQVSPGYLVKTLEKVSAPDGVIVLDVGDHTVWFNRIFTGSAQEVLISGSWRTMGFGLPAAISAKLAQPDRQVIALVGDGSLAMSLGEFLTAVRYRVPIMIVIMNNGYLAMEKDKMELKRMDPSLTSLTNPDFAKFAEACGGKGFRVERPDDLENVLREAVNSSHPALVDVVAGPVKFPGLEEKKAPEKDLVLV